MDLHDPDRGCTRCGSLAQQGRRQDLEGDEPAIRQRPAGQLRPGRRQPHLRHDVRRQRLEGAGSGGMTETAAESAATLGAVKANLLPQLTAQIPRVNLELYNAKRQAIGRRPDRSGMPWLRPASWASSGAMRPRERSSICSATSTTWSFAIRGEQTRVIPSLHDGVTYKLSLIPTGILRPGDRLRHRQRSGDSSPCAAQGDRDAWRRRGSISAAGFTSATGRT